MMKKFTCSMWNMKLNVQATAKTLPRIKAERKRFVFKTVQTSPEHNWNQVGTTQAFRQKNFFS